MNVFYNTKSNVWHYSIYLAISTKTSSVLYGTLVCFRKNVRLFSTREKVAGINLLRPSYTQVSRVGYRNPVLIWHRYLCNRYVLEPNPNADFGAMPERSVEIFVLCFSEIDVKSIITVTAREKLFILNLCSNVNVLYSHSDLKAQLRKWEHPRRAWMQWLHLLWRQQ